jgi:SM-20-related protein
VESTLQNTFLNIADGVADQGYAIADQFLSLPEVSRILALDSFAGHAGFHAAGIGKQHQHQVNEAIRGDRIRWLDDETAPDAMRVYLNRLHALRLFLKQSLYISLVDVEVHQTIYPTGAYYKRHLDQFKKDDHRKLSVICYLNLGWTENEGGQLRIYLNQSQVDVLPLAGRLVCFRSDLLEHEVLPATRERLSITGWMLDRPADLRHL